MKTYSNFTTAYYDLIKTVYENPEHEASPRGMKIKERLGHSFRILDIRDRLPFIPERDFSISYVIAEAVWYFSGNNSTDWIANYSSFWRNISDDGITANSAYGARIFKPHHLQKAEGIGDWTQWDYVKEELKKDPDSRRAVIHIRVPQDSVLASKDVPCTIALQFFIRDNQLHQVAVMRSSDLILGIAYDIPAFTMFQEMLALELGVECGTYTHMSNSLHIYERNYKMVENIISNPPQNGVVLHGTDMPMPKMPSTPPLGLLHEYESKFRVAKDIQELNSIVESFKNEANNGMVAWINSYWHDWILILAAHRASKLGSQEFRNQIIDNLSFKGYKFFAK